MGLDGNLHIEICFVSNTLLALFNICSHVACNAFGDTNTIKVQGKMLWLQCTYLYIYTNIYIYIYIGVI